MNQVNANGAQIQITGALTRETVEHVRLELLSATSGRRKKFALQLEAVDTLDSTGVQLLASFLKSFPNSRVVQPSEPVRQYWERIGASSHFAEGAT